MTVPSKLIVTDTLWNQTVEVLQQYTPKELEAGCFWYGLRGEEAAAALVLGIPRQINRPRNFEIPADDLVALINAACEPAGLVAVAQLHIHPGADVRHSLWDDKQVVSKNVYSLVIPNYCRPPVLFESIGIHRFENGRWNRMSPESARGAVIITACLVDTR
jgi:hypothetical protein